jgi:hypothetical protein
MVIEERRASLDHLPALPLIISLIYVRLAGIFNLANFNNPIVEIKPNLLGYYITLNAREPF